MVLTQFKITFQKLPPRTISYRVFTNFVKSDFERDLFLALLSNPFVSHNYGQFLSTFEKILDKHAPIKRRKIRGNQKPFMNKPLRQAIMRRSKLLNIFQKTKLSADWEKYRKQRNYCLKLRNKARRTYFNNMQSGNMSKNNFWKTLGPFFSDKIVKKAKKILLIENNEIISDNHKVAEIFSKYFSQVTDSLDIPEYTPPNKDFLQIKDPVLRAIEKFKEHPSVKRILASTGSKSKGFSFQNVYPWEMRSKIRRAKYKKSDMSIPMAVLKQSVDICVPSLTDLLNNAINDCHWPLELGSAVITPAHKMSSTTAKENYRPISVLPSVSKIFEKLLYDQLIEYMNDKLSPFLCGFRKQYSTQHALIRMLERWKHYLDDSGVVMAVLMDLSKAYDCIPHDLLIAKLHAYGLNTNALCLLQSYLTNRKQKVKVNESFSEWVNIIIGIPQGSVLGPLLFNIFINDLFLAVGDQDLCNFADDNTLYKCRRSLHEAQCEIENHSTMIISWFEINGMKMNPDKCHVIILGNTKIDDYFTVQIGNASITPESEVTLLGITLDNKLDFTSHISKICKGATNKINALLRIAKHLTMPQKKLLVNAFFYSHFNYCPLVWMFSTKDANNKIEKLHKRALQIIHSDYDSALNYEDLLLRDNSVTIHQRNLQFLMTEIFKTIHGLNPSFMKEFFIMEETCYNLRCQYRMKVPRVTSTKYGLETLSFRGCQIWNTLPSEFKYLSSVPKFKEQIKSWSGSNCNCRICT